MFLRCKEKCMTIFTRRRARALSPSLIDLKAKTVAHYSIPAVSDARSITVRGKRYGLIENFEEVFDTAPLVFNYFTAGYALGRKHEKQLHI